MAGLLDNIYDPSTYAGSGGLLSRLLPMMGTYQSAGFQPQQQDQASPLDIAQWPAGPMGAPVAKASNQPNNPISVGGYQMPRIGNPDQFVPQQATTPPNATPTQGMAAVPQMPVQVDQPGFMPFYQSLKHGGGLIGSIAAGLTGQRTDPLGVLQQQQRQTQNLTVRALINKGVDPATAQAAVSNPDMLKALITQSYGPQTLTPLGNGYVADKQGNIKRAYEPDDKIPVGFQKTANGLQPIPGGPSDPAYLRLKETAGTDPNAVKVLGKGGELYKMGPDGQPQIIHKNEDGTDATLSDDATKAMAAQYLSGDKSVLQNLGRGAQGAANIVKLREEITKQAHDAGLGAKDIVDTFNEQAGNLAGQRSIGTRAANISLAANEANNMIPIALKASEAVPRGEWMPWNKMIQAYQTGTSSPELARFVAATNSLVNAYVRAVSPSGVPTDSMREHAYSMLNSAQSARAYEAVTKIMQDEMKAALQAPEQVRKELRGGNKSEGGKVTTIDGYKIMEH